MAGENWGRRIVEQELGLNTVIHDDGTADGMYDLRIGPVNAPKFAIECFQAVDSAFTEIWNLGPARGPLNLSLENNWIVEVSTKARLKTFKQNIESVLQELERRGIYNVLVDHHLKWRDTDLFARLSSLDINHAFCYEMPGSGKVELGLPGIGGAVDEQGAAVPDWISGLLREPRYRDVLDKLERSGAAENHAFVFVGFAGAPWEVAGYLMGDMNQAPTQPPALPSPIKGVWIISQTARKGVRWDGIAWQLFKAN
ncbi:MAG TPA: hypothetical protein VJM08_08420 [Anaerolineales bacterium]|nr:hypothetical protein [Anaerolineales bacterium]